MLFKALKTHFTGENPDIVKKSTKKSSKKSLISDDLSFDEELSQSQSNTSYDFSDEEAEINNFNLE